MAINARGKVLEAMDLISTTPAHLMQAIDSRDFKTVFAILDDLARVHKFLKDAAPKAIAQELIREGKLIPHSPSKPMPWKPFWAK